MDKEVSVKSDLLDHVQKCIEQAQDYKSLLITKEENNRNFFIEIIDKGGPEISPAMFLYLINIKAPSTYYVAKDGTNVKQCIQGKGRSLHDNWLCLKSYYNCDFYQFIRIAFELVKNGIFYKQAGSNDDRSLVFSYPQAYKCPDIKRFRLTFNNKPVYVYDSDPLKERIEYKSLISQEWEKRFGSSSMDDLFGIESRMLFSHVEKLNMEFPLITVTEEFKNLIKQICQGRIK